MFFLFILRFFIKNYFLFSWKIHFSRHIVLPSISYFKHSSRNKIGNFGLYQHGKLPEKKLSKYKRTPRPGATSGSGDSHWWKGSHQRLPF